MEDMSSLQLKLWEDIFKFSLSSCHQRLSDEPDILVINRDVINLGSFRAWWQVGLVLAQFWVTAFNRDVSHLLKCFIKVKSKSRYLKMIFEMGKHNYFIILDEGRISKHTHASRIRKRSLWDFFSSQ